jgi:hypothetical protein
MILLMSHDGYKIYYCVDTNCVGYLLCLNYIDKVETGVGVSRGIKTTSLIVKLCMCSHILETGVTVLSKCIT